jgi:hypothetical protein
VSAEEVERHWANQSALLTNIDIGGNGHASIKSTTGQSAAHGISTLRDALASLQVSTACLPSRNILCKPINHSHQPITSQTKYACQVGMPGTSYEI